MGVKYHFGAGSASACNRGKVITENVYRVTCLLCQNTPLFERAKTTADLARKAAFDAQEPRQMREPWHTEHKAMVCRECGNDTFREGDRTCYGHYANFYCAECGQCESRLTETGMSF